MSDELKAAANRLRRAFAASDAANKAVAGDEMDGGYTARECYDIESQYDDDLELLARAWLAEHPQGS